MLRSTSNIYSHTSISCHLDNPSRNQNRYLRHSNVSPARRKYKPSMSSAALESSPRALYQHQQQLEQYLAGRSPDLSINDSGSRSNGLSSCAPPRASLNNGPYLYAAASRGRVYIGRCNVSLDEVVCKSEFCEKNFVFC